MITSGTLSLSEYTKITKVNFAVITGRPCQLLQLLTMMRNEYYPTIS